ncbi:MULTISPECIES: hypothetical protein [Streptomyces]
MRTTSPRPDRAGLGERTVLDVLALSPGCRLACQTTVFGTVTNDVAG